VVTVLAEVCQASTAVKTAIATLLGVAEATTLGDRELIAAITGGLQKVTSSDAVFKTIGKLLSSAPRQTQPTTMTLRNELKMKFCSFTSMTRQIETAEQRGYSEQEIRQALTNALSPGRPIRQYLEVANPSLEETRKMLQHHFQEPSATELFTSLTKAVQQPSESATDFLVRLMEIRERTRAAAKISKEHQYPDSLIQTMFHHALVTGLADTEMRITMQEVVEKKATDEEMFAEIKKLTSRAQERNSKRCLKLEASTEQSEQKQASSLAEDVGEQLRARIQALEAQLKERDRPTRARFQCINCKRRGERRCTHCWACGSSSHFERDCSRSGRGGKNQGNENRSR